MLRIKVFNTEEWTMEVVAEIEPTERNYGWYERLAIDVCEELAEMDEPSEITVMMVETERGGWYEGFDYRPYVNQQYELYYWFIGEK